MNDSSMLSKSSALARMDDTLTKAAAASYSKKSQLSSSHKRSKFFNLLGQ